MNRRLWAGWRRAGMAAAGLCVALAGSGLTPAAAAPAGAEQVIAPVRAGGADPSFTFGFTGAPQSLTVPANAIVTITADGAGGADNTGTPCPVTGMGGTGARVVTTLPQSASPTTFTINVGGTGGKGCNGTGAGGAGGFNGGAPGGGIPVTGFRAEGPGGGGAASVSVGASLLVVAGGSGAAGGTGANSVGGNGGNGGRSDATGGTAGSATGPGASPGQGGAGGSTSTSAGGAGGAAGTAPLCSATSGGPGGGFAGTTVGTGGTGGSIDGGCAATATGAGGGGGGGYFAGGGGGSATVNNMGTSAGGGGGGGGSSFATPTGTGTSFSASPIGTANNNGQVVISYVVPSSTALAASPNPAVVGQPVTLTATVTCPAATPTGTVSFFDGTTPIGTAPVNGSGIATLTTSGLAIGSHSLTAQYSGDATCLPSMSNTVVEAIQQGTSTTTLTGSPPSPGFGQPVTLTAHVACTAGIPPAGTVTFFEGATPIGTVPVNGTGDASLTVNGLAAGSHTFTAHYNGDTNCAGSTSNPVTVTVGCQTISGIHFGPLSVTGPVCLAPGSQVLGPVTIRGTGSLDAEGATIQGPLTATGGTGLRVCSTTVNGPIDVAGINGVIIIGEADATPSCGANTVRGPVIIRGNTGFAELDGNQILGPVTVNNNTTTTITVPPENASATEIEANQIFGNLACAGNTPPPTNDGHPNTVIGLRTGQCATL